MSPIQLITSSQSKLAEFQGILSEIVQIDIDLPEIQSLDPKKVIEAKLQAARAHHEGSFLVEVPRSRPAPSMACPAPYLNGSSRQSGSMVSIR